MFYKAWAAAYSKNKEKCLYCCILNDLDLSLKERLSFSSLRFSSTLKCSPFVPPFSNLCTEMRFNYSFTPREQDAFSFTAKVGSSPPVGVL